LSNWALFSPKSTNNSANISRYKCVRITQTGD
jgi:hypothetical protein